MHTQQIPPAQLWLGNHERLTHRVITYLQQQFCATACTVCTVCMQIRQQQHHAVVWICPEKGYTLAHLQEIHERIVFYVAEHERVFFILQKADYLSMQCANSLLKSMEEPPRGYHFILCAQQEEPILPTVRSRCIISSFVHEQDEQELTHIAQFFYAKTMPDPQEFAFALHKAPPSEQQAMMLLDRLLNHWIGAYRHAMSQTQEPAAAHALDRITLLKKIYATPPMPGSSALFLKNLFMQYYLPVAAEPAKKK